MRLLLVGLVLVTEAWALAQVTSLPSRRQRLRWIAVIVLLPIVGVALWVRRGARA